MATQTPSRRFTCHHTKRNGESCRRAVSAGQDRCWQHAKLSLKWKSLTRGGKVFASFALALVTIVGTYYSWKGYRDAKVRNPQQKTGNATTSGPDSPAVTGNGNSVTYGNPPPAEQKKESQKKE